tara:strand:+ start:539 stop:1372 length:834 start_codon:yes stop_codon:yes gene_type:complete
VIPKKLLLVLFMVFAAPAAAQKKDAPAERRLPVYRVEAAGFEASDRDIKAVCDSAAGELWRHLKPYKLDPFVVKRGHKGPFFSFVKNSRGELEILLDTGKTYWSQYAYQFSHEFLHLLCGSAARDPRNLWFEETLAETSSLFVMRAMARSWKKKPPYPHWADYRDSIRDYVDDIVLKRTGVSEIHQKGLGAFYRAHRKDLEKNCCDRGVNGAMALVLLRLFEEKPERWEAVRWLNGPKQDKGQPFEKYLRNWFDAAPERHKAFIRKLAGLYGISLPD